MVYVWGAQVTSLQPSFVRVELVRFAGIPQMVIIGLPSKTASDLREKIIAVTKANHILLPHCRFVFNLSSTCTVKYATNLDLPILISLLSMLGELKQDLGDIDQQLWLGELCLDGGINATFGAPIIAEHAMRHGYRDVWCSSQAQQQLASFDHGMTAHGVNHISELLRRSPTQLGSHAHNRKPPISTNRSHAMVTAVNPGDDWQVLLSLPTIERAMLIAASGWHHVVLIGPPGLGKTTVASLLVDILPKLQPNEFAQVLKIRSLNNNEDSDKRCCVPVSFQTSASVLMGNLKHNEIGLVSQAHKGVLFFDELIHFSSHLLELLKEPLECGQVTLPNSTLRYPADFLFIGVTNPCRCGNAFSKYARCCCSASAVLQLRRKFDTAWLDRISMSCYIDYQPTKWRYRPLTQSQLIQKIQAMQSTVLAVWEIQQKRWGIGHHSGTTQLLGQVSQLKITEEANELLQQTKRQLLLSERSYNNVLRVARTITDIESVTNSEVNTITPQHVAEALQYRFISSLLR